MPRHHPSEGFPAGLSTVGHVGPQRPYDEWLRQNDQEELKLGLGRTNDETFVTSMRSINRVVVNPLFLLPIFLPR